MNITSNSKVIGQLLQQISWVGNTVKAYRNGGQGFEDVLTAEVFLALDFLPRQSFLGAVIEASLGATKVRTLLQQEIEQADFTLYPGSFFLTPSGRVNQKELAVQPDGVIKTPSCFGLIEAKRIKRSSFQSEQLAREFVLVMKEALNQNQEPILWLILGEEPPVSVQGHGRLNPIDAIELHLESVLSRTENHNFEKSLLLQQVDEVVCWTTWQTIAEVVQKQLTEITITEPSARGCVQRLANSVVQSIIWHS
ncbi:hypothetical protein NIES2109_62940 (plasmid) [Nostoc sp. HK-01]|nr:hypothetical protein NIES2109_62940 [Nostoc sp. HK-01]